jgi:hypothetical protein
MPVKAVRISKELVIEALTKGYSTSGVLTVTEGLTGKEQLVGAHLTGDGDLLLWFAEEGGGGSVDELRVTIQRGVAVDQCVPVGMVQ